MNELQRSDIELVEEFKRGNVRVFNELVRRYQQKVYWLARRTVGRHEDADDITQEVFVRAYQALTRFRGEASFYTWLYRIATNLSLNAIRKKRFRMLVGLDHVSSPLLDPNPDPEEQIGRKELEHVLRAAVERLPPRQRLVFTLRYYEDISYDEMARILKRSVGGLKANYFHAVKKIQSYIQRELHR